MIVIIPALVIVGSGILYLGYSMYSGYKEEIARNKEIERLRRKYNHERIRNKYFGPATTATRRMD